MKVIDKQRSFRYLLPSSDRAEISTSRFIPHLKGGQIMVGSMRPSHEAGVLINRQPVVVDHSIARLLQRLAEAGYRTRNSCSGLWDDHRCLGDRITHFLVDGYIEFDSFSLSIPQSHTIHMVAQAVGMPIMETKRGLCVRTPRMSGAAWEYVECLKREAERASTTGRRVKRSTFLARWHKALRELILRRGHPMHDRITRTRWREFERYLLP